MRSANDNVEPGGGSPFVASALALSLPTLSILGGYVAALAALTLLGMGDGALARLCLAVIAFGVPLLAAHALLRRITIRVDLMPHAAFVHPGFPRRGPAEIPYAMIRRISVRRGPVGRLTGTGMLVLELSGGRSVGAPHLSHPTQASAAIAAIVEGGFTGAQPAEIDGKPAFEAAISAP